jgi:hypothetical protein
VAEVVVAEVVAEVAEAEVVAEVAVVAEVVDRPSSTGRGCQPGTGTWLR